MYSNNTLYRVILFFTVLANAIMHICQCQMCNSYEHFNCYNVVIILIWMICVKIRTFYATVNCYLLKNKKIEGFKKFFHFIKRSENNIKYANLCNASFMCIYCSLWRLVHITYYSLSYQDWIWTEYWFRISSGIK